MKREKDVIRLPILDKNKGIRIASVKEVIYSKTKFRILGFLVSESTLFSDPKIIKYKNIEAIGNDAIIIKNKMAIEEANTIPEIEKLLCEKRKIKGGEVLTEEGESLGIVYDTIFDEDSGRLAGFILSDGLFQDIREGRHILPYIKGITFGDEALIIPNQIKTQFEKNKETFKKLLELH